MTAPTAATVASEPDDVPSLAVAFERAAASHGDRLAIASAGWSPTYAELNAAANRAAHALIARGGSAGDRVVLLMRHDATQIAAMIATLKAGRVVVALSPADPPARLRQRMIDAQAQAIVTDAATAELAHSVAASASQVIRFEDAAARGPAHDPDSRRTGDDTAYLVYTSGSTAQPKAVMQKHRQTVCNVRALARSLGIAADDRVVLLAAVSGGQGLSTAWGALLCGASLWPYPVMERGVAGLAGFIEENAITVYVSSATLYRRFLAVLDPARRLASMRAVRIASEAATADDFRAFERRFPSARRFLHTLASTETGNIAHLRLAPGDAVSPGRLPVGLPIEGVEVSLIDEHGHAVATGAIGEILVRSRNLAAGYWRDPSLTAERFSDGIPGDPLRSYRSGDLGRFNAAGQLELHGRKDLRVKIRGYSIDPAEVEGALAGLPGVAAAAVCAVEHAAGEHRLVAYVVAGGNVGLSAGTLRRGLRDRLPGHMVPSAFVFLAELPLTARGKTDRAQLRQISPPPRAPPPSGQAVSETEALLCGLWAGALDMSGIGPDDDFFDLGGDSLSAAVVAARIHAALGVELDLGAFIDHPRLADLAAAVDRQRRDGAVAAPPLPRAPRDRPLPMSFTQERIWNHAQTSRQEGGYARLRRYRLLGPLDAALFRECIAAIVGRHEILRTRYAEIDGRPVQIAGPAEAVPFAYHDLSSGADIDAGVRALCDAEAARPFMLTDAPPLRFTLIKISDAEHLFLRANHHIIADGGSWRIVFRELTRLYDARLRGEAPPLPALAPFHYGDYAAWQRTQLVPGQPLYERLVGYWAARLSPERPALDLPFRRADAVAGLPATAGVVQWDLDQATERRLDDLRRARGTTYFVVRLAAFVALLAEASGRRELAIGSYFRGRTRVETQDMPGDFSNLVILRFAVAPHLSFADWLAAVRGVVAEAEAHCDIPHEMLRGALIERGTAPPEITAIFSAADRAAHPRFGGIDVVPVQTAPRQMPWGFSAVIDQAGEFNEGEAAFDAAIYDPAKVRAFIDRLVRLLDLAAREPDRSLASLMSATADTAPAAPRRFLSRWWRRR